MRTWIGLGIVAATLAACSGGDDKPQPEPPPVDAHEPNDTIGQAKPIDAASVHGTLGSATDHDYFSFAVGAGGAILRAMTFDGTGTACALGLSTTVDLYGTSGNHIATSEAGLAGCSDLLAFLPEGSYAVDVHGDAPAYPAAYTLVTSVTAALTPPSLDTVVAGSIASTTEVECYAIANTTAADVTVRLATYVGGVGSCTSATAGQNDTVLRVLDGTGKVVATNDDGGVPPCSQIYDPLPAGATQYACVTAKPGQTVPAYYLLVSTGSEPNDTIAQATPIDPTSVTPAWLASATDHDYYWFTVPAGGGILRAMTFDETGTGCNRDLATTMELYTSAGARVASAFVQTTSGEPVLWNGCSDLLAFLPQGEYALDVNDAGAWSKAYPAPYVLSLSLGSPPAPPYSAYAVVAGSIATPAEYECYTITNATAAAVPVRLETYVGGVVLGGDGRIVSGSCSDPTYQDDTVLRLLDESGAVVASDDDGGILFCSLIDYSLAAGATRYACVTSYAGTAVPSFDLEIAFP